ncbi:MAG: PIG-L family deacetylase [Candidatus Helarchaeota archaeon]|nr:PIG-L family deacetylase [Candidatus Helarchaeota archaeon]
MLKRYSFICAHPDDEVYVESFIRLTVQRGHDVELVSMTKGEYGTLNASLKGEKLGKIRVKEFQNAAESYGISKDKVKFLGMIDGQVTVQKAMKALRKYFQKRKPEIIFAPEYTLSVYVHPDHLNTGRAICLLLKNEFTSPRPRLFVFHSFKNNVFLRSTMHTKAFQAHQSQIQVIGFLFPLFWLYKLMNGFFCCRRFMFMEACRRVSFKKKIKITFLDRIFHAAASFGKLIFKAWSPGENKK